MRQPNLFSSSAGSGSALTDFDGNDGDAWARTGPPAPGMQGHRPRKRSRWITLLLLAEFLLAISVRIFIGVIVLVLPWSSLWDSNHVLQTFPHLARFLSYGATRGIVSGVGLMNLWIAVDDTLHRSERYS